MQNDPKEYKNFESSLGFKINKLSKALKRYSARMIDEYKVLGIPELFTLNVIGDSKKQITVKDICSVHWADQAEISRGVKKLIQLHLIKKNINFKDKRFSLLSITSTGERLHKDLVKKQKIRNQKLLQDFKRREVRVLQKLLDKLLNSSQKYLIFN
ncbi:MAG: MarR family winged helix-turn-helix transcriptional regulator [Pelagibacteraceae bacterium]|jgi:DNA-binding MarR family transcriptional regulator